MFIADIIFKNKRINNEKEETERRDELERQK